MKKEPRLPRELLNELEGAEWRIEAGKGHYKLFVNGKLAGLVPSHHNSSDRRPLLNTRSNIRKILAQERAA